MNAHDLSKNNNNTQKQWKCGLNLKHKKIINNKNNIILKTLVFK